ncbi:MAG: hypothetical protein ACOC2M_04145, partial [bacterium]
MDLNDFRNPKLIVLTATPHATNCYMAFKKSKNENSKKKLLITKISDIDFKIEDNKHSKIYSSIANPKVRKPKNSPFSLHPGKAKIYGFIKNGWRSCITQIYNNLIKNCS